MAALAHVCPTTVVLAREAHSVLWRKISPAAEARAEMFPSSTRVPEIPGSTESTNPGTLYATVGMPEAAASHAVKPQPSAVEHWTWSQLCRTKPATSISEIHPVKFTKLSNP